MFVKSLRRLAIGNPSCLPNLNFISYFIVLFVFLRGDRTMAGNNICNGYCDFNNIDLSICSHGRSCIETVNYQAQKLAMFVDDDVHCYLEKNPVFPAYISNISAGVLGTALSVNISWEWPDFNYMERTRDYQVQWGLQYIITLPGEDRTICHGVTLSEEHIQHGKLNIPCMKFRDDGFPALEFNVTSVAFVLERIRTPKSNNFKVRMTPRRLQEITIQKPDKLDNTLLSVWNSQLQHHINDNVLTVNFIPAPPILKYVSYEVRVFKAMESKCLPSSSYVDKIDVVPSWPVTSVTFNTENYTECTRYCVSVHPVRKSAKNQCSGGCVKELHDMILFDVPSRILKCISWNGDLIPQMLPLQKEITVTFNVSSEYQSCFEEFTMTLFSPTKSLCVFPGLVVTKEPFYWNTSGSIVTFQDVTPGNYCIRVTPNHSACRTNLNICSACYSEIYELVVPRVPTPRPRIESPVMNRVMLISILSVTGVVIFVVIAAVLWQKLRPPPRLELHNIRDICHAEDSELLDLDENLASPYPASSEREIVFLYTHDELTSNRVKALSNFLKGFDNFKIILDKDYIPQITAEHSCFISEVLKYSCPESGVHSCHKDNKRIIIVESKRAVSLLRKRENVMRALMKLHPVRHNNCDICRLAYEGNEACNENDENLSDDEELSNMQETLDKLFFCLGISFITSTRRQFIDDCHIFVVQFNDFPLPENETFKHQFPGKRYCLPSQLGDLCLNLHRIDSPRDLVRLSRIKEMQEQWENDKSYKELLAVYQKHS